MRDCGDASPMTIDKVRRRSDESIARYSVMLATVAIAMGMATGAAFFVSADVWRTMAMGHLPGHQFQSHPGITVPGAERRGDNKDDE
jgi:hypothetical protein